MIQNGDYECKNIVLKMFNFQDRKEKFYAKILNIFSSSYK